MSGVAQGLPEYSGSDQQQQYQSFPGAQQHDFNQFTATNGGQPDQRQAALGQCLPRMISSYSYAPHEGQGTSGQGLGGNHHYVHQQMVAQGQEHFNQQQMAPIPSGYPVHALPGNAGSSQMETAGHMSDEQNESTSDLNSQHVNALTSDSNQFVSNTPILFSNQVMHHQGGRMPQQIIYSGPKPFMNNHLIPPASQFKNNQFVEKNENFVSIQTENSQHIMHPSTPEQGANSVVTNNTTTNMVGISSIQHSQIDMGGATSNVGSNDRCQESQSGHTFHYPLQMNYSDQWPSNNADKNLQIDEHAQQVSMQHTVSYLTPPENTRAMSSGSTFPGSQFQGGFPQRQVGPQQNVFNPRGQQHAPQNQYPMHRPMINQYRMNSETVQVQDNQFNTGHHISQPGDRFASPGPGLERPMFHAKQSPNNQPYPNSNKVKYLGPQGLSDNPMGPGLGPQLVRMGMVQYSNCQPEPSQHIDQGNPDHIMMQHPQGGQPHELNQLRMQGPPQMATSTMQQQMQGNPGMEHQGNIHTGQQTGMTVRFQNRMPVCMDMNPNFPQMMDPRSSAPRMMPRFMQMPGPSHPPDLRTSGPTEINTSMMNMPGQMPPQNMMGPQIRMPFKPGMQGPMRMMRMPGNPQMGPRFIHPDMQQQMRFLAPINGQIPQPGGNPGLGHPGGNLGPGQYPAPQHGAQPLPVMMNPESHPSNNNSNKVQFPRLDASPHQYHQMPSNLKSDPGKPSDLPPNIGSQGNMASVSLAFQLPPSSMGKPGLQFISPGTFVTSGTSALVSQGIMMPGLAPATVENVLVPWGWKRIFINDAIVYFRYL